MSVTGNLTIIILTFMDTHLKTPMYFSFKNFAFLEVSFTMVCSPRFLYSIISGNNTITFNTWRSEVKFAQSCPTLWDSKYCSPPGSSVHGVLQARIMEWVAIPFSRGSSQPRDRTWVSCIAGRCFIIWTIRGLMPVLVKYFLLDSLESQHFFFWQSRPVTTMWPSVNPFMNSRVCIIFVLCCWISGLMIVITPLSMGLWIEFCDSSAIHHFGCDAGPLLKISSSDTWFIEQIIMICGVVTFIITLIGAFIVTLIGVFLIYMCIYIYSVQFLRHARLFVTPWTAALQASLSITNTQSLSKFMPIESVISSYHLILCCPLLLLPSIFSSIRVFSNESALRIRWPKY